VLLGGESLLLLPVLTCFFKTGMIRDFVSVAEEDEERSLSLSFSLDESDRGESVAL
jgi:hypothetical protein